MNSFMRDLIAIDLGTTNTLIYSRGKGLMVDEPSVAMLKRDTRKVVEVGEKAKKLFDRHGPEFEMFRPLRDGVITDFEVLSAMLRLFLNKVPRRFSLMRKAFVLAVPVGITPVEKRALSEAAKKAGAGEVFFVQEPIAAAIGAGLRIDQPVGRMVIDIGGGTTEVAVVCNFAVSCCESLSIAGDELDDAICRYVREQYNVEISPTMAESIKIRAGSANESDQKVKIRIRGTDKITGELKELAISGEEIREAIHKPVLSIVSAVKRVLEKAPPNATSDVAEEGIWLAGGGALLNGWQNLFYRELGVEVNISNDPLRSTIRGIGEAAEKFKFYQNVFYNGNLPRYD
ncbi:MAG: rod shape-determining protein [Desulforhabdus sp.]|nr:rod shape-determining protein [Desulforhabdus sp.]